MTITAVPPQRPLIADETSSEVTSPLLLPTAGSTETRAAPVPRSRPRWFAPVLATVVVAALLSTGVGAYLVGAHASDRVASAAVPVSGPAPTLASSPAAVDGPRLTDAGGVPVDEAVAEHVRAVYAALQSADLGALKRSYSASGSDDWLTVKPKLDRAPVRAALLGAMRTAPSHRGAEYRYRSAGYSLTFQQPGSLPAGLVLMTGPWTSSSSDTGSASSSTENSDGTQVRSTGSSRATSAPRRSSTVAGSDGNGTCAAGTTATSSGDYPCRDNATGTGVYRDGSAGVHGLKPCPPGTVVPSDPDEPTRNASTGQMCGYVSGSG